MKKKYIFLIVLAILIKLSLLLFAEIHAPEGKFLFDSSQYINTAQSIAQDFKFAQMENGALRPETFRTPGYPLFLALFHNALKIPLSGISFIQILLVLFVASIVYWTALQIDKTLAFLSAFIILFDPPLSIYSIMILSETLFLFFMAFTGFLFILYLKSRKLRYIFLTALAVVAGTYTRPIAYYLGIALAVFIVYANFRLDRKRALIHAFVFFVVVYALLGAWQARNYWLTGNSSFSIVAQFNLENYCLLHNYSRWIDSYASGMTPVIYYAKVIVRSFLVFFTSPGSLKYFNCHWLVVLGKVLSYPWMVFWLIGFIFGVSRIRNNIYFQAIIFIALYFIVISIVGVTWLATDRFRMPVMPFLAIISAYGWHSILSSKLRRIE